MRKNHLFLRIIGTLIALLLVKTLCPAQQKAHFTQYMYDGMVLNPAYAGAKEALSLTFIHRGQWSGIEGAPNTQILTAHTLFKKKQVGLGLFVSNDEIGVHNNQSISTNYSYHLALRPDLFLSFGLRTGIHRYHADYASILEASGNDPMLYNDLFSKTFFDVGAGLYLRSPRLQVGFSIPEILPQKTTVRDSLSVRLNDLNNFLFARYSMALDQNITIQPSVLLKYLHGVPLSFDINMAFVLREVVTIGVSYRKSESVDFLMRFQVTPQLQIGYAYDMPVGQISEAIRASHELAVQYLFKFNRPDVASPR